MPLTDNSDSLVTRNLTIEGTLDLGDFTKATHNHEDAVGGGTLSAAAITSGTLDGNRLAVKNRTITKIVYIESPTALDSFPIAYVADVVTLAAVRAVTDAGTVDFNIEKRAKFTPDQPGTGVWSPGGLGNLQAVAVGVERTSFDSGNVAADNWLNYNAASVAGSPTKLWIAVEYTID